MRTLVPILSSSNNRKEDQQPTTTASMTTWPMRLKYLLDIRQTFHRKPNSEDNDPDDIQRGPKWRVVPASRRIRNRRGVEYDGG